MSDRFSPAVIVMVKEPRAGLVKTRLCPPLNPQQAANLALCFASDSLRKARKAAVNVILAYTPTDARDRLTGEFGPASASDWIPQRGADLGERMDFVIAESVRRRYAPVVI